MASRQLEDGAVLRLFGRIIFRDHRPFAGWQPAWPSFPSGYRRVNVDTRGAERDAGHPWLMVDGYGEEVAYGRRFVP